MIANNPRSDNQKFIRMTHLVESGLVWSMDSAATATSFKTVQLDGAWLPLVGHNPLVEATFDNYERKMLTKVTWKMTNFRVFLATQLYQPVISQADPQMNAPAQQTFDIQQKWGWRMWRFNNSWPQQPSLLSTKEERAIPFNIFSPKTKIYGTMHLGKARQMNWYTGDFASLKTTYSDLQNYLKHYMMTGLRGDSTTVVPPAVPAATFYPTLEIQLMPDDPYPSSVMTNVQLVNVRLAIEYDIHYYTTWLCSKMTQS